MKPQPELPFTGQQLSIAGQNLAIESANQDSIGWAQRAYELLCDYLKLHGKGYVFIAENARMYAEAHELPAPPSKRAFGSLIVRLAKEGWIKKIGYAQTRDPKSHRANCSQWIVC